VLRYLAMMILALLAAGATARAQQDSAAPSDDAVAQMLIRESIARYSGPCPCPYSTMRNGRRCGDWSAWSKPGGAEPLCYRRDVTDAMIRAWRARQGR